MEELYRKYFQKSKIFLYPLLKFDKTRDPKPFDTYVSMGDNIDYSDRKLICVYKIEDTEEWKRFEIKKLMTHPLLETSVFLNDGFIAYVFDFNLSDLKDDYDNFIIGKYSRFSSSSKKTISTYFGIHTPEWVYVESYLFPGKYFKLYADLLNENVEHLKKGGELCNKFDSAKENCPEEIIIKH